ncbi:MAG: SoxR reducing system RseC family protein [Fibrobacteres bacterium]|nr:SoxR reducing system RseC family protein [Fibrobacterota bacterium]
MRKQGIVKAFSGDKVILEISRASACGSCSKKGGCSSADKNDVLIVKLPNPGNLEINQTIELEMADSAITKAAFAAYGIPLAGFLTGAFIPQIWNNTPTDTMRALSAFIGLGVGYLLMALIYKGKKGDCEIRIAGQEAHQSSSAS